MAKGPERKVEGRPRPFFQLTEITVPTLEIYQAPEGARHGGAVLVVPGGGLQRLAYEHEGLEVADWLNATGFTAAVLKYRVPAPAQTGLMDAQRAMGLLRAQATKWQFDPHSLGFMGFSAGGEIGAWLITHPTPRAYEPIDAADQQSCRPDFVALIYSGGLLQGRGDAGLKSGIATNLNRSLPPVFLAHAFDDASENSLHLALALKRAGVPTEFHLFHAGAHGFGARPTGLPVSEWKQRFVAWASALGHLDSSPVRSLANAVAEALQTGRVPPAFAAQWPAGSLKDAYAVQRRVVRTAAAQDSVAGYKGAGASAAAQEAMGIQNPLTGVLWKSGRVESAPGLSIEFDKDKPIVVETAIGYVMGVDFSTEIPTEFHARDAVAAIVPVIELPRSFVFQGSKPDPRNSVASNIGSARFIVGKARPPGALDPNSFRITLDRDGHRLHETTGASAKGGQWHVLRELLNQLTARGVLIREGDLIITGALGTIQAGTPGRYEAHCADFEPLVFEIR